MDSCAGLLQHWQMMRQLCGPASGQDGYYRACRIKSQLLAKLLTVFCGVYFAHQWVPNEFCRYACLAEKFFFEREDAECLHKSSAHQVGAPGPPGPELRADVVNVAYA